MLYLIVHSIIWLLGILYGIVPLVTSHGFGLDGKELYPVDDQFSMRIMLLVALSAVGSMTWSVNVKLLHKTQQKFSKKTLWATGILISQLVLIVLGYYHLVVGYSYFVLGIAVNIIFFCMNMNKLEKRDEFSSLVHRLFSWLVSKSRWNAVFYILLFVILVTHNTMLINNMDIDFWPKISLFFNRVFNQLAIVGLLYFIIQSSLYVAPKWSRTVIWTISAIIPLLIIADYYTHAVWNTSIMGLVDSTGLEGFLDLEVVLKGGGIHTPIATLACLLGACLVVLFLIVWACNILSRRLRCAMSPKTVVYVALLGIIGATVEQSIGGLWKNNRDRVVAASEFDFQVSVVKTSAILADFQIEFKDHSALQHPIEEGLELKHKPDIYLIFLESFRADALTLEIAPNMFRFQEDDAQQIEKTWACANGTHVSWFGTFSGRLPIYWKTDKEQKIAKEWPGLNTFHEFKDAGYELGAYITTELAYRDMGAQFFGELGDVFTTIRDNREDDPIYEKPIADRDRLVLEALKDKVRDREQGGHFDIVGLDSSHFYYNWAEDFDPPFTPYYQGTYFPSNPTEEEVQSVVNKYHNSVAYCDHLVGDFIGFLKEQGKYDESIVIVLGDHGEELQDNGGWLHVSSLEAEQIRVPIMIKWPKSFGRGVAQETASQLDILPSLLGYLIDENLQQEEPLEFIGNSLLEPVEQTIIAYTGMGGKTGDALIFERDEYKAYFTWENYANWRISKTMSLTQFYGPDGRIHLASNEEYLAKLKEIFPDVKDRVFDALGTETLEWEDIPEGAVLAPVPE